jgi:hypothetical protein
MNSPGIRRWFFIGSALSMGYAGLWWFYSLRGLGIGIHLENPIHASSAVVLIAAGAVAFRRGLREHLQHTIQRGFNYATCCLRACRRCCDHPVVRGGPLAVQQRLPPHRGCPHAAAAVCRLDVQPGSARLLVSIECYRREFRPAEASCSGATVAAAPIAQLALARKRRGFPYLGQVSPSL